MAKNKVEVKNNKIKRPFSITCISFFIGFLGAPASLLFSSRVGLDLIYPGMSFPDLYLYSNLFSGVMAIPIAFYLWKMKRLAAYALIIVDILQMIVGSYLWGNLISFDAVLTFVMWVFLIKHIKKMT